MPLRSDNNARVDLLQIEIIATEDGDLASISGRVDIGSSPALRDRLLALLEIRHGKVLNIDLSAVTHMDSSGVATLIEALRIARRYDTTIRLQGLQGRLLGVFQSTGILSLFNGSDRVNIDTGFKAL